MKRIMVDMDDVICNKGFLGAVNKFLNTNYQEDDIKQYYIQDIIPKERKEEYREFFYNENIYDFTELLPNVCEIIEKLQKKYEVYIATAYIFKDYPEYSGNMLKNKFEYLQKVLPCVNQDKYIFTTNKQILDCDIRIDDKLSNLEGKAETKILFTAYHNKEIKDSELKEKGIIRVDSWNEIEKILL